MDRFLELAAGYSTAFQSPLIAFVLTSLIIEMTPGPNMAYLAVLGASRAVSPDSPPSSASRWDWRFSASRSALVRDR